MKLKYLVKFKDFKLNETIKQKDVFIFLGRFQPFHLGHLKCMEDLKKEFGCPGVIALIYSTKEKDKSPFSIDLLKKELELIIKNEKDLVIDYEITNRGLIPVIVRDFQAKGYNVIGAGCGEDRFKAYQSQVNYMLGPKTDTHVTPDFKLVLTKRYNSATQVREAIKANDKKTFLKLMPKYLIALYDEFKKQIDTKL